MSASVSVLCVLLFMFFQGPINVSGRWALSVPGRNGTPNVSILTLNQSGQKVSGTLVPSRGLAFPGSGASGEIYGAKVEGNAVSFYVWRGSDKPAKQFYKGVMHDEEIDFTVTGGPASNFGGAPNGVAAGSETRITATRSAD